MHCLIAAEAEAAPIIRENLIKRELYPGWEFSLCINSSELLQMSRENMDVVLLSRFLPGEDALVLLDKIRGLFPSAHIVLLAGKESEQRRSYIKAAQKNGFDNIVTGKLPGDRPYTIFTALASVGNETGLEWEAGEEAETVNKGTNAESHKETQIPKSYQQSESISFRRKSLRRVVGKMVVVTANKGGAGKTTSAIALSISLARAGLRTALVDLDLAGPNVATFFDIKNCTGIEAISRRGDYHRFVPELLVEAEENLFVLPGVMDQTMPFIGPESILGTVETLAEEFDLVICDTPPGFWEKEWLFDIFPRADMVLSVVDQSKFSETETSNYVPKLIMMGVGPEKIKIVCNKFKPKLHSIKKVEAFFNSGLKKSKVYPRVIVTIPEDWESFVKDGYHSGIPGINDALSPWKRLADEVAREFNLSFRYIEKTKDKKGFFTGFLGRR
jgi:cellulose biosynthesis protein BcsQ/DNA-binding NarL/FixJ family response regulator